MFRSIFLGFILLVPTAQARMPKMPDLSKWDSLSEYEKTEAGAFLLFYELATKKVIGGNGLCVDWEPGDSLGNPGKISVGLPSDDFFETGKSTLQPKTEQKVEKLKELLSQVKKYLDSGCGQDADCLQNRTLTITGYADGQGYGGTLQESLMNNKKLAQSRAEAVSKILNPVNFGGGLTIEKFNSPYGEAEGRKKISDDKYRINCPERRVTVVDIGFNAKSIAINSGEEAIAPSVFSTTRRFVHLSNLAASMQITKAAGSKTTISTNEEADLLIEKILKDNGMNDPAMISACKNTQTRTMVKEHVRIFNSQSPAVRESLLKQFSQGEYKTLQIAGANQKTKETTALLDYYKKMQTNFGGIEQMKLYPGIATSGQSTSLNDCFSAKNALATEMALDRKVRSNMCKPVNKEAIKAGSNELSVKFEPESSKSLTTLHIGCNNCMTGFRFSPTKVVDTNTGKKKTVLAPSYRDRETKEAPTRPMIAPSYFDQQFSVLNQPKASLVKVLGPLREAVKGFNVMSEINNKKIIDPKKINAKNVLLNILNLKANVESVEQLQSNPAWGSLKESLQISDEFFNTLLDLNQRVTGPEALDTESQYIRNKIAEESEKSQDKHSENQKTYRQKLIDRYEQVFYPGSHAREVLGGWWNNTTPKDNLSFGGMKKPRFYILDNCDCEAEANELISQALKEGRPYTIREVPLNLKAQANTNSCIISIPTPPSCLVDPTEAAVKGKGKNGQPSSIKWLGADGNLLSKTLSEMPGYFKTLNANAKPRGCEGLSFQEIAQKIVDSVQCRGDRKLPHGANEKLDCSTPK